VDFESAYIQRHFGIWSAMSIILRRKLILVARACVDKAWRARSTAAAAALLRIARDCQNEAAAMRAAPAADSQERFDADRAMRNLRNR